jgi:UDP-N-acetylglucosamine--N-acetylmuramyl-(pentapeptide) pyrophosphoryl-undecaprenol N-acetylglucosamine transferase
MAFAGWRCPSLVFCPDIEPGLAIRAISSFASRIAVPVEQARQYLPRKKKIAVSGYPVRADLLHWTREEALETFNLIPDLPILLVAGGSRGARSINQAIQEILTVLLTEMQVIHITGHLDWEGCKTYRESLSEQEQNRYRVFSYLHQEMGAALRCADLVVSRGGASILGEYPVFELPSILVPYPHAWRYQKTNAFYLSDQGAAEIVLDEELLEVLLPRIVALIKDQERLSEMRARLKKLADPKAAQNLAQQVVRLAENAKGGVQ